MSPVQVGESRTEFGAGSYHIAFHTSTFLSQAQDVKYTATSTGTFDNTQSVASPSPAKTLPVLSSSGTGEEQRNAVATTKKKQPECLSSYLSLLIL
jgi:hypothetical protein